MRNKHNETPREVARSIILGWVYQTATRSTSDIEQVEEEETPGFAREVQRQLSKEHDRMADRWQFDGSRLIVD